MLLVRADPNPVSFSPVRLQLLARPLYIADFEIQAMVLEDDCMDGLRTVVSQMIGGDNTRMPLVGSVHLVIVRPISSCEMVLVNYDSRTLPLSCVIIAARAV